MSKQVFYLDADHLEDRGLMSQSPSPHLSEDKSFVRRERGTEQRYQGRGLKSSLPAGEHNLFQ